MPPVMFMTREKPAATRWAAALLERLAAVAPPGLTIVAVRVVAPGERRIGEFLRRPTLPFNGYADQVASLYAGMDLKKNY